MSLKSKKGIGGGSGFFSQVASGLGQGLGRLASDVLPRWTAQQLEVQSTDQLNRSTFNRRESPRRMGGFAQTTGGSTTQTPETKSAGLVDLNISTTSAMLLVGVAFAVVMIMTQ
jgi:hypothetical protein